MILFYQNQFEKHENRFHLDLLWYHSTETIFLVQQCFVEFSYPFACVKSTHAVTKLVVSLASEHMSIVLQATHIRLTLHRVEE